MSPAGDEQAGDLHDTVARKLADVGQRYTGARRSVVEVLAGAGRPSTIAEVVAASPEVLRVSSVYRNMVVLEQAAVVRRVQAHDEHGRYELAEDLTGHHHHLVCTGCGTVSDFTAPARLEGAVADALAEVAGSTGFRTLAHRLDLLGLCSRCA